jgi:hypothetical protein
MFTSGHPALLYILIVYSVIFLLSSKSKDEFLLIFTIFLFFLERNSWQNAILSMTTSPIRTQPSDIALVILTIHIITNFFKYGPSPIFAFRSRIFGIFTAFVFATVFIGVVKFGYAGIAEFRTVFYFLIIMLFISTKIKSNEIPLLIKKISTYLIPLILLVPINLILTNDFTISTINRQLGAFMYESITLGIVSGLLYYYYIDKKYKLPLYFLPGFFLLLPYTTHRTVWLGMIFMLPFILIWLNTKKSIILLITITTIGLIILLTYSSLSTGISFFQERTSVFTSLSSDSSGKWRILVWNAVMDDATFFGKGLGARFIVYADKIGFNAMFGAHNGFILILYYLGYFGVSLLFLLFIYFGIKSWKNAAKKNSLNEERVIFYTGFLAAVSLTSYMIGYGFELIGVIFLSFTLKYSSKVSRKEKKVQQWNLLPQKSQ